jgi:hypothetical protein
MPETTPRQIVYQTLEFANPPRAARQLWLLPWAAAHYPGEVQRLRESFPDDIIGAPGFQPVHPVTQGDAYAVGRYVDEWGCIFENRQAGVIGEVKEPFIKTWADLDRLRQPKELLAVDREQVNAFCRQTDRFVMAGCCPRPFERLQFLRSSVNVYLDLGEESPEALELLRRIHEFYLQELEVWARTDVDGLNYMDDWGAQRALLISPRQWRRIFKPLYKDYIDLAHSYGKKIFMHSDGYIADVIPDLVELGLDALNSQLFVMDIEALGAQFAGQLTFWGEIDRQHILPAADPREARRAVQRVKAALWRQGGCIAQCEFGAGARPENVWAVYETWEQLTASA